MSPLWFGGLTKGRARSPAGVRLRLLILLSAIASFVGLMEPRITVQAAEEVILTINQVNDTGYPQVEIYATITDESGIPVDNLSDDELTLREDGTVVNGFGLTSVEDSPQGISVVLVIDTSGSMGEGTPTALEVAREAATSFVEALDLAKDQVAVVAFNDTVEVIQPFSTELAAIDSAINSLAPEGETRFNEAAFDAVELAATLPPGRKAVVILTDGRDTESPLTIDDAINNSNANNTPVYTIGFGPAIDPMPLERLAKLTGGRYLEALETEGIRESFETIAEQLRQQYIISFEASALADDSVHNATLDVDYLGNTSQDSRSFIARPNPASAEITAPMAGQDVAGTVEIAAVFDMPGRLAEVAFYSDGVLASTVRDEPFSIEWDTTQVDPGNHTISVEARDHVGNRAEVSTTVTVVPPLTIELLTPQDGQEITQTMPIAVKVDQAFYGVDEVQLHVNDAILASIDSPPYESSWEVETLEPGSYEVSALVRDMQGNEQQQSVQVTVNPPPILAASIVSPSAGETISQTTAIEVAIDHSYYGVERVELYANDEPIASLDAAPYEATWDIEGLSFGEQALEAKVFDTQGNQTSDAVAVTVLPPQQSRFPWPLILLGGLLLALLLASVAVFTNRRSSEPTPGYTTPSTSSDIMSDEALARTLVEAEETVDYFGEAPAEDPLPHNYAHGTGESEDYRPSDSYESSAVAPTVGNLSSSYPTERGSLEDRTVREAAPGPLAYLIGLAAMNNRPREYPLYLDRRSIIGRGQDADIFIDDSQASRRHAAIRYEDGAFIFVDLAPTNPSLVNGGELVGAQHVLQDGDEIIIGESKLIFKSIIVEGG